MHQVIHSIGTISRRVINILYVSTFCNDISTTYQRLNHLNSLVVQVGAAGRAPSDLRLRSVLLYERSPAAEEPVGEGGEGPPPWPLTRGHLHQGERDVAVTSPHSRGLRHNHAWHGGERGTPLPKLATSPPDFQLLEPDNQFLTS